MVESLQTSMGTFGYGGFAANAAAASSCGLQSAESVWLDNEVPNGTTATADHDSTFVPFGTSNHLG